MSTYALKSIARRSSMFGVAIAVFAAAIIPAASAFADALNPLTERSLLLTSSAPGFQDTDGSGNVVDPVLPFVNGVPRGSYAPPGSGPNGKKSGQTFTFKVTSNATVNAFSLQYCTTAAGLCQAPGDNDGDARLTGDGGTEDRATNATSHPLGKSDLDVNFASMIGGTDYKITVNGAEISAGDYANWTVATDNAEDPAYQPSSGNLGYLTGKKNFISLIGTTGLALSTADKVELKFIASDNKFITNPGKGSFFVKINTYNTTDPNNLVNELPADDDDQIYIVDGGVTVANVMTDSIHITTKVLETMSFSVGTRNKDTTAAAHGTCDNIEQVNGNRLQLGDVNAEYSLKTDTAYDVHSYWRLSSNSSGGATVYYSGNTLANTVGDEIAEVGPVAQASLRGTEQFGLAFVDAGADTFDTAFSNLVATQPTRYKIPTLLLQAAGADPVADPAIFLAPLAAYAGGTGDINEATPTDTDDAKFAFQKSSNTIPVKIAENNEMVISCATAKMRYIANIGADTPAGVYTTKINYLAAPQY